MPCWFPRSGSGGTRTLRDHRGRLGSFSLTRSGAADYSRHYRDRYHDQHHYLDVPVYARNIPAQEKADEKHAPDPRDGTYHVEAEEKTEAHPSHAAYHGRKRADYRHELGDNDGLAPVALEELARARSMLLVEEDAVGPAEDSRPGCPPDPVTRGVSHHGGHRKQSGEPVYVDVELAARGQQSGGNEQGIAGKKYAEQQSRF